MKKTFSIILNMFLLFLIVSCEKPIEIEEEKIPIDSLYFSCKLDGELVTLKSPVVTSGSGGSSLKRLFRLKNVPKDSVIIGYYNSFQDDSLRITIGFSKRFLVDSTSYHNWFNEDLNYKGQIYATGLYSFQYAVPKSNFLTPTAQYEGFYIEIYNINRGTTYTSFLDQKTDYSKTKYDEFKSNTSCQITKSMALNSGIYSDYRNAWFIESTFNCRLYENSIDTNQFIVLSDGHFNGVF